MKEKDISFLVQIIDNSIDKKVNREMEKFDLTTKQGKFLGYLQAHKERSVSQKELQNHFEISHATTAGIVKRLESKGMVRTYSDEDDKRSKIVELAAGEEKVHRTMTGLRKKIEEDLYRGFTEEEQEQLLNLLHRVYKNATRWHKQQ